MEIGQQALDEPRVVLEGGGRDGGRHAKPDPIEVQVRACERGAADLRQVGPLLAVETPLAAREGEEGLDEALLLTVRGEELLTGRSPRLGRGGVAEGDLHQGALPGDQGGKLARSAGDEVTLHLEGGFEAREELVQGAAEPAS